ncbi:MAG: hypothetical protein WBC62_03635 [Candidatus Macondimonas sp.]
MLYLVFFIFVIVFLGGLLLAYRHFQQDDVPLALAMRHGAGGYWDWSFSISRPAAWGPRSLAVFGLLVLAALGAAA